MRGKAMSKKLGFALAALVLALAHVTCNQAILTAPAGSTISLFANPEFVPANGGISVVSALVIEPAGTPVADGTVVQFFTNLGSIPEQGKTNDGVVRVNFVSDSRSGKATVTAFIGGAGAPAPTPSASPGAATTTGGSSSASVEITIGSALPDHVLVTADPVRIRSNDPRQSRIVANVFDASGNPVQNVPVIFTVAQDVAGADPTEMMASGGAPVFTDTNGQAVDFLQTRYPTDAVPKSVTVTATTANTKTADVKVQLN
jgi:hypothetical protein